MAWMETCSCDNPSCNSQKKNGERGWFVGFVFPSKKALAAQNSVAIQPWDDELAREKDAFHLCGLECVKVWVAKKLTELST